VLEGRTRLRPFVWHTAAAEITDTGVVAGPRSPNSNPRRHQLIDHVAGFAVRDLRVLYAGGSWRALDPATNLSVATCVP
jgi:hypothetical protein